MQDGYKPPFTISDKIIELVSSISELLGRINVKEEMSLNPKLRRDNRIKTIHASLAIENNSLTLNQVTDIINGKHIIGAPEEIREVKNAYEAYDLLLGFNPYSYKELLKAHAILMKDLVKEAGRYRNDGVGIFAGERLIHMAPPADRVGQLMEELLFWVKSSTVHPLIKSSVFHYEFEFIHPFSDGNGRMGRMWQTLLLYKWRPVFAWLPIETLIKEHQEEYYDVLGKADKAADSGMFIEFMLNTIAKTLNEMIPTEQVHDQVTEQVEKLMEAIGEDTLTTKQMMERVGIKHRPTFRQNYLLPAMDKGILEMTIPDKPNSSKQQYRKKRKY